MDKLQEKTTRTGICHVCLDPVQGSHVCKTCKRNVHAFCGSSKNEGYGASLVCEFCSQANVGVTPSSNSTRIPSAGAGEDETVEGEQASCEATTRIPTGAEGNACTNAAGSNGRGYAQKECRTPTRDNTARMYLR